MKAEAETLKETVSRHLTVLADFADAPDPDDLPKAQYSKREVHRLRRVAEQLQPLLRVELTAPLRRAPAPRGSTPDARRKPQGGRKEEQGWGGVRRLLR